MRQLKILSYNLYAYISWYGKFAIHENLVDVEIIQQCIYCSSQRFATTESLQFQKLAQLNRQATPNKTIATLPAFNILHLFCQSFIVQVFQGLMILLQHYRIWLKLNVDHGKAFKIHYKFQGFGFSWKVK